MGKAILGLLLIISVSAILTSAKKDKDDDGGGGFFDNIFKAFRKTWQGKMWTDERREEGKEKQRYLIRNRDGQSWKKMEKDGSVNKLWVKDGPVKLLIHSYSAQIQAEESKKIMKDQNMMEIGIRYGRQNESYNIILVDWTPLATDSREQYDEIVKNVPYAAEDITDFLKKLKKKKKISSFRDIHIIGFGMGAHVAGMVGKALQDDMANVTIGRITGLDPNGPGFVNAKGKAYKDEDKALTKEDAEFVDIIHCNMGKTKDYVDAIAKGRYGSMVQAGNVDFYPNGGESQKGCDGNETPEKACSQRKCSHYFALSINKKFVACPCDDWDHYDKGDCKCDEEDGGVLMGDQCPSEAADGKKRLYISIKKDKKDKDHNKKSKKERKKEKKNKKKDDIKDSKSSSSSSEE